MSKTPQMQSWASGFGRDYTDRNAMSLDELEDLHTRRYGLSRTAMSGGFIGDLDRGLRVLEVGSNIGNPLGILQRMGFSRLTGLELQRYALSIAQQRLPAIRWVQGSALQLPFASGSFDLVYTSGVLIHLSPEHIGGALREIARVSRRFVWGLEYFAENVQEVPYQGRQAMLWKTDFARLYAETCPELRLVREVRYPYVGGAEVDTMFLLEKSVAA